MFLLHAHVCTYEIYILVHVSRPALQLYKFRYAIGQFGAYYSGERGEGISDGGGIWKVIRNATFPMDYLVTGLSLFYAVLRPPLRCNNAI